MSTIKVVEVIDRVEIILQDSNLRWPRLELQQWLNDSYFEITKIRPDANTKSASLTCVAGTRQKLATLFPSGLRLIDVVRNMAVTSNLSSIRQIDRRLLDDQRPGWHAETGSLNIQHFVFNPELPKEFFVYPPALVTTIIEIVYADTPTLHALAEAALAPDSGDTTVISMDDIYLSSIIDFILYRSYLKDADYAANDQRAAGAYQVFKNGLGDKTQSDAAVTKTPNPVT
jgi:hypothetical protein